MSCWLEIEKIVKIAGLLRYCQKTYGSVNDKQ